MTEYDRGTSGSGPVSGLFDGLTFPERLQAHVVDPADGRRIAGYAVAELATAGDFLSTCWLSLVGEWPSAAERDCLSCALTLLAPVHVGESAAHAAVVARVAACADEALGGIVGTAVGLFSRAEVDAAVALAAALGAGGAPAAVDVPDLFLAADDDERARHASLVAHSARWPRPLPPGPALNRVGCGWALLVLLGQREPLVLHAWAMLARLPVVFGEARHVAPGSVTRYATRTPDYRYVEETR